MRLANLRSGDLDMVERWRPPTFQAAEGDPNLRIERVTGLGFQPIEINVGHGPQADNPLGKDKRVRQALELSIDRDAINQVVFAGLYTPGNQPFPPTSPYFDKDLPVPPRDVDKAKALLKAAGQPNPAVELDIANSTLNQQVGQIIQAMAAEAGFDVRLKVDGVRRPARPGPVRQLPGEARSAGPAGPTPTATSTSSSPARAA